MDPDPGGPKHADPVDPDPQHWVQVTNNHRSGVWALVQNHKRYLIRQIKPGLFLYNFPYHIEGTP
jgi:hypothetical protein